MHEGNERLHPHRDLGPRHQRHHVGRAERRRVREAQVQVVDESGRQPGSRDRRVQLLRKREIRVRGKVMGTRSSAAAVELPVEKCKGDVVRHPHDDRCLEQLARGVRDPPPWTRS